MPGGDRRGPCGMGPKTGRGAGFCAGNQMPGYASHTYEFGYGPRSGRGMHWNRGLRGRYGVRMAGDRGADRFGTTIEALVAQANRLQEEVDILRERLDGPGTAGEPAGESEE